MLNICRLGGPHAVSSVLLCLIERGIGARDDAVRGVFTCDDFGDAKARCDDQHLVVPAGWALLEILPQHFGYATSACQRRVGQQDEKLFAAITALRVAAAKNRLHALPHMREHRIAAEMSTAVVDRLEMIEIQHHERKRAMRAAGPAQF
jgi:hypothetical protein